MNIKIRLFGLAIVAECLLIGPDTPEAVALPTAQTQGRATTLDLLLQPRSYVGRRIEVVMDVKCENEDLCKIDVGFAPRRPIALDVMTMDIGSRKELLQKCASQGCQIVAFGRLVSKTFVATKAEVLYQKDSEDDEDIEPPRRVKHALYSNGGLRQSAVLIPLPRHRSGVSATT